MLGRCWVEIGLDTVAENYRRYCAALPQGVQVIAVVKANAYGHGAVRVARVLAGEGARCFAVSNLAEAVALRRGGVRGDILVLGYTPPALVPCLLRHDLTQTLFSVPYAKAVLQGAGRGRKRLRVQIKLDSGMCRLGLNTGDPEKCAKTVRKIAELCRVEGVFSHLSSADGAGEGDIAFTARQSARFAAAVQGLRGLALPYIHLANSAGGLSGQVAAGLCNAVRPGIALYGLPPSGAVPLPHGMRPALCWKTRVAMVKRIAKGCAVGYGRGFIAPREMLLATLPIGYADGYARALSGGAWVGIGGEIAPVVGRICMDQMMVDVSRLPRVALGDEVVLMGDGTGEAPTATQMAAWRDTIPYEVVCGISARVARRFLCQKSKD